MYERFVADEESVDCVTLSLEVQTPIRQAVEAGELPDFYEMKLDILLSLSLVLAQFLDTYQLPTVEECFEKETVRDLVMEYARRTHMEEMVVFLFLQSEYEQTQAPAMRQKLGPRIVERFFTPGAEYELNVSGRVKKSIEQAVQDGSWPQDAFSLAKKDQMKLFVFDMYPRFTATLMEPGGK